MVAKIKSDFVGEQMNWDRSGATGTTDFAVAARDNSKDARGNYNTPMQGVSSTSTMNCWEMILLAAYQTGMLGRDQVYDWYTNDTIEDMMASQSGTYKLGDPKTARPDRGDIVFMHGLNHVVIAQGSTSGGKEKVYSFWPPSDYSPATVQSAIASGKIDSVKKGKTQDTSIESLADWMKALSMEPNPITFGPAGW